LLGHPSKTVFSKTAALNKLNINELEPKKASGNPFHAIKRNQHP